MPRVEFTDGRAVVPADFDPADGKGLTLFGWEAIAEIGALERAQLVACAGRGATLAFTAEELFASGFRERGGDAKWIADSLEVPFEWWQIVDAESGARRFTIWLYAADCGLVFEAGTTSVVAQAIQFGSAWELEPAWEGDASLLAAIADAHRAATAKYPRSGLAQFDPVE